MLTLGNRGPRVPLLVRIGFVRTKPLIPTASYNQWRRTTLILPPSFVANVVRAPSTRKFRQE